MTAIQLIRAAMQALESMPCGFVGQGGATQQAFLYLQEALEIMELKR